jgi:hypothetical protein
MTNQKDELAALKKKVEELEAKVSPPKSTFVPMSDAEHRDWVHQMQERRMSMAMPPSVVHDLTVLDDRMVKEITLRDARAPNNPAVIPQSQQVSRGPEKSSTPGYIDPRPLRPPDGVAQADRLMDHQDALDRAELARKLGKR